MKIRKVGKHSEDRAGLTAPPLAAPPWRLCLMKRI